MDNSSIAPQKIATSVLTQETLLTQASGLRDTVLDYKELMLEYAYAIRAVKTKLEIIAGLKDCADVIAATDEKCWLCGGRWTK